VTEDENRKPNRELRPESGHQLRIAGTGAAITVGEQISAGGGGYLYRATDAFGTEWVVLWLISRWRESNLDQARLLLDAGSVHPAFCWPVDLVLDNELNESGILFPIVESRFQPMRKALESSASKFHVLWNVTTQLADAMDRLHDAGLCYPGLVDHEYRMFVDPNTGELSLIGWDAGSVCDTSTPYSGRLAPMWSNGEQWPSPNYDNYALAVILFEILLRSNPFHLLDEQSISSISWASDDDDPDLDESSSPTRVFVFDPTDASHRPDINDPVWMWWYVYPQFLRERFIESFTLGLSDPTRRVSAAEWHKVLNRLRHSSGSCHCGTLIIFDPQEPEKVCLGCGSTFGLDSGAS